MEARKKKLKLIKGDLQDHIPKKISNLSHKKEEEKFSSEVENSSFIPYTDLHSFQNLGINKKELETEIEKRVQKKLELLKKETQEEAYNAGFNKGKKEALSTHSKVIEEHIKSFHSLISILRDEKNKILFENETIIIKLIFLIAKKITLREIHFRKEFILNLIRKVFESLECKTKIVLHLSKDDTDFIQSLEQEEWDKIKKDNFKKIVLQSSSEISPGGCIVETNYSQINASVEMRFEKVWKTLEATLLKNKVKDGDASLEVFDQENDQENDEGNHKESDTESHEGVHEKGSEKNDEEKKDKK